MPAVELRASEAGPSWADLIARMAGADRAALEMFYDLSSPSVFGLILRIVGDQPAAQEITLKVYTEVWEIAGEFNSDRKAASSWLLMLARRRAIDYLGSRRPPQRQPGPPFEPVPRGGFAPSVEDTGPALKHHRIVQSAFRSLDPKQGEAIGLAFFYGQDKAQIAVRLGEPLDAAGRLIHSGMVRLRELLRVQVEVS